VTRHVIAVEGKPSKVPQTRIAPGALWLEHDGIPVSWNFSWEGPPIGYGCDFQRDEETGEVSMDFDLRPDADPESDDHIQFDFTFYADQVEQTWVEATEEDEAYRLVTKARIRGLAIVPSPVWPVSQKTQGP
jgi:hypothetical protein